MIDYNMKYHDEVISGNIKQAFAEVVVKTFFKR